jgi:hypothetical protein
MTPEIHKIGAMGMLFVGIAIAVAIRMRCSRDRRRIREDLTQRRCRLMSARMITGRSKFFGAVTYDVEFVDPEDDPPQQAQCSVRRGIVTWPDQPFERAPQMAEALPVYGQNWRG